MRPIRALIAAAALLLGGAAAAQTVTSSGPESVSVTIYRAPGRDEAMELAWLQGYALITEKRRVTIPAGRAVIRFEGVAQRMLPESAIVTGLPAGVREKNLDSDLLSPRSLYAHGLNREVTLRRTTPEGKVSEQRAIIRSGPDGAAILETKDGFVAANCGSDKEAMVYDSVPPGLSSKPTLSVETESPATTEVTLTLSYLALGFDWEANYVATMRPGGRSADLFAWVTLASGDMTSFVDAETMVVAGEVQREDRRGYEREVGGEIAFRCFLQQIFRMVDSVGAQDIGEFSEGEIVVTGYRAGLARAVQAPAPVMVVQEELGDLKLYRVPHATTVAAMSQKQVAMLDRKSVPVEIFYRSQGLSSEPMPAAIVLRAENRKAKGLGVALPAGAVAVFEPLDNRQLLVGEGRLPNRAIDEDAEVEIAAATQVFAEAKTAAEIGGDGGIHVTNANPFAIRYEARDEKGRWSGAKARRVTRQGRKLWVVDVPANATARFRR